MTGGLLWSFLAGAGIGLSVALPVGPMCLLCLQRTLAVGIVAGLMTGLAAATVQATYGFMAATAAIPLAVESRGAIATVLSFASAAVLFWFSAAVLRRRVSSGFGAPPQPGKYFRCYLDALTMATLNPLTPVLFLGTFQSFSGTSAAIEPSLLVAGIFAGSFGWYIVLSWTAGVVGNRLSVNILRNIDVASGLLLFVLASIISLRAVTGLT